MPCPCVLLIALPVLWILPLPLYEIHVTLYVICIVYGNSYVASKDYVIYALVELIQIVSTICKCSANVAEQEPTTSASAPRANPQTQGFV